jgi:ABC-2 type transport system permease protein
VVIAGTELPDRYAAVISLLPSAALGDSLRAALVEGSARPGAWLVMTVRALVATVLARRFFRWSD